MITPPFPRPASLRRPARRGGPSHKTLAASEQERPDVAARRAGWRAARPFIDPERLVFIDETGVNTNMTRLYGRAPRGRRVSSSVPFGHWKTMTFVAALRLDGITAPWLLDGAMDGQAFGPMSNASLFRRSGPAISS